MFGGAGARVGGFDGEGAGGAATRFCRDDQCRFDEEPCDRRGQTPAGVVYLLVAAGLLYALCAVRESEEVRYVRSGSNP